MHGDLYNFDPNSGVSSVERIVKRSKRDLEQIQKIWKSEGLKEFWWEHESSSRPLPDTTFKQKKIRTAQIIPLKRKFVTKTFFKLNESEFVPHLALPINLCHKSAARLVINL